MDRPAQRGEQAGDILPRIAAAKRLDGRAANLFRFAPDDHERQSTRRGRAVDLTQKTDRSLLVTRAALAEDLPHRWRGIGVGHFVQRRRGLVSLVLVAEALTPLLQ